MTPGPLIGRRRRARGGGRSAARLDQAGALGPNGFRSGDEGMMIVAWMGILIVVGAIVASAVVIAYEQIQHDPRDPWGNR